jgi:hypothetical protein
MENQIRGGPGCGSPRMRFCNQEREFQVIVPKGAREGWTDRQTMAKLRSSSTAEQDRFLDIRYSIRDFYAMPTGDSVFFDSFATGFKDLDQPLFVHAT